MYGSGSQTRKEVYYLDSRLNSTIMNRIGYDATQLFESVFNPSDRGRIIDYLERYYIGIIDTRYSYVCEVSESVYLGFVSIITAILVIKFITSLCILRYQHPEVSNEYVIISIPCYTESKDAMEKTIGSISESKYPDEKKLLVVICDGMNVGKDNLKSTAEITLDIFDRTLDSYDGEYRYESLGQKTDNTAKVYYGWSTIPYVIIIKKENRGKRDSQLILFNLLKKINYKQTLTMTDIEFGIYEGIQYVIGIDPYKYKLLFTVDADTFVHSDALSNLVYRIKESTVIALCGETMVANRTESLVTSIQVYEYYINHSLNKAFESTFSSVTCLPGCFSLYKIRSDKNNPLIVKEELLKEYSDNNTDTLHKKNLLSLGEDRFFTTLLIKHFPEWKIKFVAEAKCETNVPSSWKVLLSQRRRWINSTVHNLLELLCVNRLCGVCCFSMRFIVFMDLLTTVCLPAMSGYFIYIVYTFITGQGVPLPFIIMTSSVVSIQILVFIIRRDFMYLLWFLLYCTAFPIWTIVIPVYSFINMDDFSWGSTHVVKEVDVLEEIIREQ